VLREYFGWSRTKAAHYLDVLERVATRSGGAKIAPEVVVSDCEDWEDNRILELAADSGAVLIVSSDRHLLDMSPWRGTPIVATSTFVAKVDAMRRAQNRIGRRGTTS